MNNKTNAVLLIGPAGSGKTTLARTLANDHHITVIETGNLLSSEAKNGSALGGEITPYQKAGELVPSDLVKRVISARLTTHEAGPVVFDGFPRNMPQVNLLNELLEEHNLQLHAIFILNVGADIIIRRLSGRRLCKECGELYNVSASAPRVEGRCDKCGGLLIQREDDCPEVVTKRLQNYERETMPVVRLLKNQHAALCKDLDAQGSTEELQKVIAKYL